APPDWMALKDLQKNKHEAKKYGMSESLLSSIKPISVISLDGFGEFPAVEICQKLEIKDQHDKKLEEATKEIYKKEFFSGKMKESSGPYAGLSTEQAKKQLTKDLISAGLGDKMYELTGKVVCRCLTPSIVKIVTDQWFLNYSDEAWKRKARENLAQMKLYPEQVRGQFEYVLGWLNNWACTREFGLGTRLPWDEKWVIESLSDSTIYMAYYTMSHYLQQIPKEQLNDALFDYIFYGKGEKPKVKDIDKMRDEFAYWYPLDFRNSGKDLIQNHLSFSIFNHVAIFEKSLWPRGFSVNGFVTVDGEKMSKSKGNIILMRQMAKEFGPDPSRFTIISGGEYLDDANWDSELARSMKPRLQKLYDFITEHYEKGVNEHRQTDSWMESKLAEVIRDSTVAMDDAYFRTALQRGYYDLQRYVKWYLRRTANKPNKHLISRVVKAQILLLAPIIPFFCEEAWESLGEKEMASFSDWPSFDEDSIKPELDELEESMERTLEDVKTILTLIKKDKPQKIELFVAERWKFELYYELEKVFKETRNHPDVLKKVMSHEKFRPHGKEIPQMVQRIIKSGLPSKLPSHDRELSMLSDSTEFLKHEFGCEIGVKSADGSTDSKARNAIPGKPAIKVS
ncbi:MAG: leucine--tRNA ligase, partial [Nanoarchaeota archaeon]